MAAAQAEAGQPVRAGKEVDKCSIEMSDVRQGLVGDCYFIAALAAVADLNPNFIEQMIEVDENARQWVVKLRDVSGKVVKVRIDMIAGLIKILTRPGSRYTIPRVASTWCSCRLRRSSPRHRETRASTSFEISL